ncbi:hypothetical protein ACN077_25040 [Clostridium chromiireducens]|uniref:hypothetical protein n=1 Tax=Clostridium chromiireducens TaxID=225345 RepID=UPI003AF9E8E8
MFNLLIGLGMGSDIVQHVLDMIDAGMTVATILSFLYTLGVGTAAAALIKQAIKKKAFRTIAN